MQHEEWKSVKQAEQFSFLGAAKRSADINQLRNEMRAILILEGVLGKWRWRTKELWVLKSENFGISISVNS